jgi:ubiquinone/menaquinone biosynthesis C-methylase UbiE
MLKARSIFRARSRPTLFACLALALACAPSRHPSPSASQIASPSASPRTASQPPRQPAQVFGHEHAEWLEREGREESERPDEVIAAMHLKDGDVVAEIGCGTGFFSRRLARAVGPQGKVYAEDIQPEMLSLLQEYAARDGDANIATVLGTATDPNLPKRQMDWILLVDVYHEFQEPKPMLARMREALKPDGRIALVEYRAEDHTADHISTLHRMSVEQVLKEWTPAGFELVQRIETLPTQHLLVFKVRP